MTGRGLEFSVANVKKHMIPLLEKEITNEWKGDMKRDIPIVLFTAELLETNTVSDETYEATKRLLGEMSKPFYRRNVLPKKKFRTAERPKNMARVIGAGTFYQKKNLEQLKWPKNMARVIGNNIARSLFDTFLKDTPPSRTMQAMQSNPIQRMLTLFKVNKLIIPQIFYIHSLYSSF
jgi:hypothetical protein